MGDNAMKRLIQFASLWTVILGLSGLSSAETKTDKTRKPLPFALTISGGISLGSYEAGVNWALVKYLKQLSTASSTSGVNEAKEADRRQPNLLAISGASAGSINAVVSAMNWCAVTGKPVMMKQCNKKNAVTTEVVQTVDNNMLREIWVNVDIDTLFPVDPKKYVDSGPGAPTDVLGDGMFARSAFDVSIENIEEMLEQNVFIPGCEVPVTILTTREVPQELSVGKVTVRNQRFVFSLKFVADADGTGHFENFYLEGHDGALGNVVYLPRTSSTDERVSFERLKRLIYASSAFPVAFGKVRLEYCTDGERGPKREDICGGNRYLKFANFVDGGMFDNIPLGSADVVADAFENKLEMQREKPTWDEKRYFLFISPETRRSIAEAPSFTLQDKPNTFGLTGLLSFLNGALTTSSDYELYTVLNRKDKWSPKIDEDELPHKLVTTSRFFPITGAYLGHFGAFLDRPFREFDYYVGVYDAVINLAEIGCQDDQVSLKEKEECEATEVLKIYEMLGLPESKQASSVFITLAGLEHPDYSKVDYSKDGSPWSWIADHMPVRTTVYKPFEVEKVMLSLLKAVEMPNDKDDDKFKAFVMHLYENGYKAESKLMKRIIERRNDEVASWYAPAVGRAGNRLQKLQDDECRMDTKACQRIVTGLVAFGAGKYFSYNDRWTAGPSSESREDFGFKIIPYELNTDMISGGFSASYLPQFRLDSLSLDLKVTPVGYNKFGHDWVWFSQADLYLSKHSDWYASIGAGPTVNFTWNHAKDYSNLNAGIAAYAELAKTLRFTAGFRSFDDAHFNRNNFYLTVGLVDFPGMISRIWRAR